MRARVLSALFLSLVLILGAGFLRHSKESGSTISINGLGEYTYQAEKGDNLEVSVADLGAASQSLESPTEKLTTTDLVSRQLILDYLDLTAAGENPTLAANILAERYVDMIPTLGQPQKATREELVIVSDSIENLAAYSASLTNLRNKLAVGLQDLGEEQSSIFASSMEPVYEEAAQRLKNLPVPESLSSSHLKLLNNYLAMASAMRNISDLEADSISAFASVVQINQSLKEESAIFMEMSRILIRNGV